ncbi:MFS transporter [Ruania alba]|uniref:MFS transporter, DHA1 family, arabinose polymer transporter n=1 Tax=Ruania alba TaxID=648782 RepID=A0A1H5BBJ1_9MICO|nr:MFS transporter [Ruania alba]SED51591.1 MFS transporter, DHA1 family, arabinose polymer transporter [Ruania alba]
MPATPPPSPVPLAGRSLSLALLAMAIGGFTIGTTEFASMGLLPQIAVGLAVTVPEAGHLISAYALGVVVGAPMIVVAAARLERKRLLVLLACAIALGNALSAVAPGFASMTAARFLAGLPHGAYFGVAALIAATLAGPARRGRAVSLVMLGLTIATMVGVPLATILGQLVGWRSTYGFVVLTALVTVVAVWRWVPALPRPGVAASARSELRAFRHGQVWFALGIGAVGFGGMFAVYSYIGEIVPEVFGLSMAGVPVALAVFGIGMTVGNLVAGRLSDWNVMGTVVLGLIGMAALLAVFALTAEMLTDEVPVVGMVGLFLIASISQFLGPSLQTRLLDASPDAPSLAAALHHSALNIGNATGAWIGGAVIAAGFGYLAPAWAGAVLAVAGLVVTGAAILAEQRARERALI